MFNPVTFNDKTCTGCNHCVEVCLMEILEVNPEKGKPPLVKYPDECAYDGACWMQCPQQAKRAIIIDASPSHESLYPERREAMKPGIEVVPVDTDVLVIGGGLAGCMAGIKASEYGGRVTIAEKANTLSSSCAGTGVDHAWAYVPIIHEKMGWSIEDLIEAEMILHASRARQESRRAPFGFVRADFPEQDDAGWLAFLALRKYEGKIEFSKIPIRQ